MLEQVKKQIEPKGKDGVQTETEQKSQKNGKTSIMLDRRDNETSEVKNLTN